MTVKKNTSYVMLLLLLYIFVDCHTRLGVSIIILILQMSLKQYVHFLMIQVYIKIAEPELALKPPNTKMFGMLFSLYLL